MRDLNEKEKKIIEIIQQIPKSFKELHESGDNLLRSESTLDRTLKSLQRINYIESFPVSDPNTRIKKRYRLTEQYHIEKEALNKDQKISKMIKNRLNWQNVHAKMGSFLEFEYPTFYENTNLDEARDIHSDVYSYLVFFNIDSDTLSGNSEMYFHLMLYLILRHPDEKYESMRKEFDFSPSKFQKIVDTFKEENKLLEFNFKKKNKKRVYYLIADDPILYSLKQQAETIYFNKFLLCWQFPEVHLEDHFDFLFNFSHQILEDLIIKFKCQENQKITKFLNNNRICLLTYIRKYILEFLDKIKIENTDLDIDYPLELLPKYQKEEYAFGLLLSPEILTGIEKRYLEYQMLSLCSSLEKNNEFLNIIETVVNRIVNIESNRIRKLYLKSRLLMLIRIFYHQNKTLYKSFRKEYNANNKVIKISYSKISEEIMNDIYEILPDIDLKREDFKKKFIIRHLLERIDHFTNQINKHPKNNQFFYHREYF